MTTPERLRSRQRRTGVELLVLGLFTVGMGIYFHEQDIAQRECLATQVHNLTAAFGARADIGVRDSRVKTRVIKGVARATSEEEVRSILARYVRQQDRVDKARRQTPTPDVEGKC